MARNGSGTYNRAVAPYVAGTTITAATVNSEMDDIATALTGSMARDGQAPATANIPMGGFRLTGLGNAIANTDAAALGQVLAKTGGTVTGDVVIDKTSPIFTLNKTSTTAALIDARTANLLRWRISLGTAESETGSNVGSNFFITRYNDAGAAIEDTMSINRATGVANFAQRPTHAGVQLAPQPQSGAGVGQFLMAASGDGAAYTLPAGGTWAYALNRLISSSGGIDNAARVGGVAAGGTTVGAALAGHQWNGLAWRIA